MLKENILFSQCCETLILFLILNSPAVSVVWLVAWYGYKPLRSWFKPGTVYVWSVFHFSIRLITFGIRADRLVTSVNKTWLQNSNIVLYQWVYESVSQTTSQAASEPVSRPFCESINQSVSQSANQPPKQVANQSGVNTTTYIYIYIYIYISSF